MTKLRELTRLEELSRGRLLPVKGDGMEPTLREGGYAVVAPRDQITADAVYVLLYQGHPIIRRCQMLGGDRVRLLLDNERYTAETDNIMSRVEVNDMVIGRVIGVCNPM